MTLRNILNNLVANFMGVGVGLFFQIASVPLFLHCWGKIAYGEWLVLSSVPAYLALSDFGLGMVLGNTLTSLVTSGRRAEAQERLQTIWAFQLALSVALLGGVGLVVWFGWLSDWLHLTALSGPETTSIVLCLAIYVLLNLNSSVFGAIFRGGNENALGVHCMTLVRVWEFGGTLLALVCGAQPATVAQAMVLLRASGLTVTAWLAHRRYPDLRLGFGHLRFAGFGRELSLGVNFLYFTLGNSVLLSGMPLVLNQILGAAAVVNFIVIRSVCRVVIQLYSILYNSMWPEITRLMALEAKASVRRLNRFMLSFGFWTAIAYAIFMVLAGNWIFRIWTHGNVETAPIDVLLFVVPVVLSTIWTGSSMVLLATNDHKTYAKLFLVASGGSLVVAAFLIPLIGYAGAGLAVGFSDLAVMPYVIRKAALKTEDSPRQLFLAAVTARPILDFIFTRR